MSTDETDAVREAIWDYIFNHRQQSVDDLAQQLGITEQEVLQAVDNEWFVVEDRIVFIATADG